MFTRARQIYHLLAYLLTYLLTYSLTHSLTHSLTPWCRTLFELLIVIQHVKNSCFLMEPQGSFPSSQKPATGPYPELAESSLPHRSLSP
jgi:hypothetical protein